MNKYYIASGLGKSKYRLVAFDNALIQAGISNYNLVRVSSILPASSVHCPSIDVGHGLPLHAAYATASSNRHGEKVATAIAVGIPKLSADIGVIMEAVGSSSEEAAGVAREMVIESMNNHGIELDHIEFSSIEGVVEDGFLVLVSAIAMW